MCYQYSMIPMDLQGNAMEEVEEECPYCGSESVMHSGVTGENYCKKCGGRW